MTLFSAMVVVTTLGVFFRYVLNNALPWAEEADRYLFIWLSLRGRLHHHAPQGAHRRGSPVPLRLARVAPPARAGRPGRVLVFLGVVFWASLPVIELTSETRATATDIPMSWVYLAAPIGCVLIAVETLRLMARTWAEMRRGGAA